MKLTDLDQLDDSQIQQQVKEFAELGALDAVLRLGVSRLKPSYGAGGAMIGKARTTKEIDKLRQNLEQAKKDIDFLRGEDLGLAQLERALHRLSSLAYEIGSGDGWGPSETKKLDALWWAARKVLKGAV